ncbi:MAG TPA: hypothetical protein VKO83_07675, partial [Steroidobacteraceae bacterium]|nr:hypothetical protein [Steroidobacteraceae bacterium]
MKRARVRSLQKIGVLLALSTLTLGVAAQAADPPAMPAVAPVLAPEALKQPLSNDWTSYSGDYTGQRFSRLTQLTPANVKNLTLAWAARMSTDQRGNVIVGGEGKGDFPVGPASMKGTVLEVNGIL